MEISRNDIWYAGLGFKNGSIQGGTRPVYIVQNDIGNKHSPTTIVAPITSKMGKKKLPTHILIQPEESGLEKDSIILCEQLQTVNQNDLIKKVNHINDSTIITSVNNAIKTSINL